MPVDHVDLPGRGPRELPVLGGSAPTERVDAARNRRRILDRAAELVREQGISALTMDNVARAAGVGVGTVYRRFGDLSSLAQGLLDEREARLQEAFLYGPPPLGPGAPAEQRLGAFLDALLERAVEQLDLLLVAETDTPTARYDAATYPVYRIHVASLLGEAGGVGEAEDAGVLADCLLAPLASSVIAHQLRVLGLSPADLRRGIDYLLARIVPSSPSA